MIEMMRRGMFMMIRMVTMRDFLKSTFLAGGVAFIVGTADGQIPATELPAAIAEAKPGDVIVVRDGIYPNHNLSLSGAGTAEAPIIIRAETPGGVIFSGQSALRLRTDFAIVSGFHFKEGASPEKYVIEVDGKHCRLTEVVIESYNPKDSKKEDKWVSLKGTNHRVDASSFMNKTSRSVTLIVWRQKGGAESHVIAGNLFLGRPKGASGNGFETIRIGTSDESESDSGTVIEGNLFESCDGEMEALSIKAGKVTIRGNTLIKCAGTITWRHGDGSLVEKNLIAGKNKKETGGIRIYGKNHVIRGNAIIGTTRRSGGAITLMSGTKNPKLNGYQTARSISIEANLLAANEGPCFKFDGEMGKGKDRTEAPTSISAQGNFLSGDKAEGLLEGAEKLGAGDLIWAASNELFVKNRIPKEVTRTIPPPLNCSMVGSKWFRKRMQ